MDLVSLHQHITNSQESADSPSETIVCDDVDLIHLDGRSLSILSSDAFLFDLETPRLRLDLNKTCGKAKWSAVGRRGHLILVSGYFEEEEEAEFIKFVLVDSKSMSVTDTLKVDKNVSCGTLHIRMLEKNGRIFAVASRDRQFVDILEIRGDKLKTNFQTRIAVDVTEGKASFIRSLEAHPTERNCVLVVGDRFKAKTISVEAGPG